MAVPVNSLQHVQKDIVMKRKDTKTYDKINREVSLWTHVGTSFPLIGLALFFFINVFENSDLNKFIIITGFMCFFSISVVWWWWAIHRIRTLSKLLFDTTFKIDSVRENVKEVRNEIVEIEHEHKNVIKSDIKPDTTDKH